MTKQKIWPRSTGMIKSEFTKKNKKYFLATSICCAKEKSMCESRPWPRLQAKTQANCPYQLWHCPKNDFATLFFIFCILRHSHQKKLTHFHHIITWNKETRGELNKTNKNSRQQQFQSCLFTQENMIPTNKSASRMKVTKSGFWLTLCI